MLVVTIVEVCVCSSGVCGFHSGVGKSYESGVGALGVVLRFVYVLEISVEVLALHNCVKMQCWSPRVGVFAYRVMLSCVYVLIGVGVLTLHGGVKM